MQSKIEGCLFGMAIGDALGGFNILYMFVGMFGPAAVFLVYNELVVYNWQHYPHLRS